MKKQFLILFVFISVLAFGQAPQRFNKVIVTGDITSPKFIKTGSTADSVLLGNGSARSVNSLKTDTVSLSNRINAKATGSGTANGTNTGDETLTSIKTKLGAASSVSDGYLTYNMFNIFNGKEPSFTKNTGFNKNFGTTAGTVLEGRTFGTAANSAVGDFIRNQNSSAQSANMWISGKIITGTRSMFNSNDDNIQIVLNRSNSNIGSCGIGSNSSNYFIVTDVASGISKFNISTSGAATFSSTVNSTGFLLNGNNLTSSLSTNYIPKWNGSSFVNSLVSDLAGNITVNLDAVDGRGLYVYSAGASNDPYIKIGRSGGLTDVFNIGVRGGTGNGAMLSLFGQSGSSTGLHLMGNGDVKILTTTQSTSPTTGALVVNGGIGADHVRANNFYGSGSNLTGVQKPITLTTNGTSGAATFSGNTLNIPNYGSGATSGQYTPTLTNTANISSSSITSSIYTHIGNVYTLAIRGYITPTASGSCSLYISVPAGMSSASGSFVSSAANSTGSISYPSWVSVGGLGTTYLTLIIEAPSASAIPFCITGSYLHQ